MQKSLSNEEKKEVKTTNKERKSKHSLNLLIYFCNMVRQLTLHTILSFQRCLFKTRKELQRNRKKDTVIHLQSMEKPSAPNASVSVCVMLCYFAHT